MKIAWRLKFSLAITYLILWVTGAVWLGLNLKNYRPGSTALEVKQWTICIHGFAAFVGIFLFGTLLNHVKVGLRGTKNRRSGLSLVATAAVLIGTGWLLYYASNETLRAAASVSHWLIGLTAPLLILIHLRRRWVDR